MLTEEDEDKWIARRRKQIALMAKELRQLSPMVAHSVLVQLAAKILAMCDKVETDQ